ncbi:hypothetical protein CCACVL1_17698 [Corchorus capsularis]|uniref:Uncharacterized protein n=1 Tax=Corchorus capsularis TaxID=210143 RepID=A0A1R3HQK6_COCAP|nr:hypothetical protein CCACVL1_17698 [Corchorus capsularis]
MEIEFELLGEPPDDLRTILEAGS